MRASFAAPSLGEGDVHIWTATLALPAARIASLAETLSSDERQRAARFATQGLRERFIAARGQLRELLSSYVGVSPAAIRFDYGAEGRPSLAAPAARVGVHFNLSHSDDVAVYAVSRVKRIGIDVERVKHFPGMQPIAERFFSPAERQQLATMSPDALPLGFYCCWTRKEAYLKAMGSGLAAPLGDFDASVSPRWSLVHFAPDAGYVGAVAVERPAPAVTYREWGTTH